jgi:hypothetical protein
MERKLNSTPQQRDPVTDFVNGLGLGTLYSRLPREEFAQVHTAVTNAVRRRVPEALFHNPEWLMTIQEGLKGRLPPPTHIGEYLMTDDPAVLEERVTESLKLLLVPGRGFGPKFAK